MIRAALCPICQRPLNQVGEAQPATVPFCSERCRQVDLHRWFSGKYAIVDELSPEQVAEEMLRTEGLEESGDEGA